MTRLHGTPGVVARRLLAALPNLVGMVIVTFLLTRALPDAADRYLREAPAPQSAGGVHAAACHFARWPGPAAAAA